MLIVETDQQDLLDALHFRQGLEMMPDNWLSSDRKQWLGRVERKWPKPCSYTRQSRPSDASRVCVTSARSADQDDGSRLLITLVPLPRDGECSIVNHDTDMEETLKRMSAKVETVVGGTPN